MNFYCISHKSIPANGKATCVTLAFRAPYLPDFIFVPKDQQYVGLLYVLCVLLVLNCFGMTSPSVVVFLFCSFICVRLVPV